ncbi:5-oxoprolinase subunit PxpB [Chitinophaga agrisoli]|uniref:5-oxoprolinase subunit PxpB n=1 Tax=Chitinophaga agrisoli TaxID=2607653 RepID=A0A5B2VQL0_9BACT|nr:5-oxoprolinase subunit PxpB [Chitinophaga agrisoli]KAA2241471.1 5-oxoprolinase subunit PxpB [Chitinophaga agrisoli]
MNNHFSITPLGDSAIIIEWEQQINPAVNAQVMQAYHRLQALSLPYITDLVPAYASLSVLYDPLLIRSRVKRPARAWITGEVIKALQHGADVVMEPARSLEIPVCYHASLGLDITEMARQKGITEQEIIALHTSQTYTVYMLGFLPGFPYLGKVDGLLATPRLKQPRTQVPAGSVGIAGEQTGIYPMASPGGWNLIGQTPLRMFDPSQEDPSYCRPGDQVKFKAITLDAFNKMINN